MIDGGKVVSPLLISIAWAVYGNIAPTLALWYFPSKYFSLQTL